MRWAGAVIAMHGLAAGCYSPGVKDCAYTCNAGACPTGLFCVDNICRDEQGKRGPCTSTSGDGGPLDDTGSTPSAYPQAVLADGPAAYFRLGETSTAMAAANEVAGAGVGTYERSPMVGVPGGLGDSSTAVMFEPSSGAQCVTVPSSATYEINGASDDVTLEAWIRLETQAEESYDREIVGKLGAINMKAAGYSLGIQFDPSADKSRLRLRVGDGAMGESEVGVTLEVGVWYHVAATLDVNGAAYLYVNGVPSFKRTIMLFPTPIPSAQFTIGCQHESGLKSGFHGVIDEVAFYRKILTETQVKAHYTSR